MKSSLYKSIFIKIFIIRVYYRKKNYNKFLIIYCNYNYLLFESNPLSF